MSGAIEFSLLHGLLQGSGLEVDFLFNRFIATAVFFSGSLGRITSSSFFVSIWLGESMLASIASSSLSRSSFSFLISGGGGDKVEDTELE